MSIVDVDVCAFRLPRRQKVPKISLCPKSLFIIIPMPCLLQRSHSAHLIAETLGGNHLLGNDYCSFDGHRR